MKDGEYIVVPILASFADTTPIGELRILADKLPPSPEFCFALGYMADKRHVPPEGVVPTEVYRGEFELVSVALASDEVYAAYLKQVGVLK